MMKTSLISAVVLAAVAAGAAASEMTASVFESSAPVRPAGEIDRIVLAKLSSLGMTPALCSDAVFRARVYLDVIGTVPTAQEVRDFLADPDKNKRRALDRPPAGARRVCRLLVHEVGRHPAD